MIRLKRSRFIIGAILVSTIILSIPIAVASPITQADCDNALERCLDSSRWLSFPFDAAYRAYCLNGFAFCTLFM